MTARPGQEAADLGGVLYAFRRGGACLGLLCLTRGEAISSGLGLERPAGGRQALGAATGRKRPGHLLGRRGQLPRRPAPLLSEAELTGRVQRALRQHPADLLLVLDPEAGGPDPDAAAVAMAACTAARQEHVPVIACTGPDGRGAWMVELGPEAATARAIQKSAAAAHASQFEGLPELTRRIDLLDTVPAGTAAP